VVADVSHQCDGAWVSVDSHGLDHLGDHLVLAVAQPADGLPVGRILRTALREFDSARLEEIPDSVVARPPVDVQLVVLPFEGAERLTGRFGALPQEGIEHLLPACLVYPRGVCQDAVEVEQHGVEAPSGEIDFHTLTSGGATAERRSIFGGSPIRARYLAHSGEPFAAWFSFRLVRSALSPICR
jgi:hypothetical protein